MDAETYDQIPVEANIVGDSAKFMKEGLEVQIARDESDNVVSITMPLHVALRITSTEPGLRGDTATNALKASIVETGANVNVPLFVNEGDLIRVDTASGAYMDRVKE